MRGRLSIEREGEAGHNSPADKGQVKQVETKYPLTRRTCLVVEYREVVSRPVTEGRKHLNSANEDYIEGRAALLASQPQYSIAPRAALPTLLMEAGIERQTGVDRGERERDAGGEIMVKRRFMGKRSGRVNRCAHHTRTFVLDGGTYPAPVPYSWRSAR